MRRTIVVPSLLLLAVLAVAPLFSQRLESRYALILEDPPVAARIQTRKELRHAAAEDQRHRIEAVQLVLRSDLDRRGIAVTGAVQTLLNAVFVQASPDRLAELRSLSGVRGVVPMPPIRRHLNRAADLVHAPVAWSSLGGIDQAGKGMKIGILDTGIDQTHPGFQDSLLTPPAGYPKCVSGDCAYTTNKVIVARSYVPMLAAGYGSDLAATSRPDDLSPRDRTGHGTATAMIAAGVQNTGPAATITGMAPKAFLGNYKIFGSPGVNDYTFADVIIQALEDAFLDGMDVVSLSVGSPAVYGPLDTGSVCGNNAGVPCDPRADAVQSAVALGMTVVVSAGNDGDSATPLPALNSIDSPATAPSAISVGASTNSHVFYETVRVTGSGVPASLQQINALLGGGPRPTAALTAPLRDVAGLGNDGKACSSLAGGSLNGAIAVVVRGQCLFSAKVNNAQTAGALGVVIVDDQPTSDPFSPGGLAETGIPAALIGGTPGQALKTFLAANPDRPGTLDPALRETDAQFDKLAAFSSQGPSIGDFGMKPELVAVGTSVYTATQKYDPNSDMYDSSAYGAFSGTSFSAPIVAGAAALVKQKKPSLNPAQIKSAVVNTATNTITGTSGTENVSAIGAGKLDLGGALLPYVTANPPTLSFGLIGTGFLPQSRTVRFTNTSGAIVNLLLSLTRRTADPNTLMQVLPNNIPLSAGASADVTVRIEGTLPLPGAYEGEIVVQGANTNFRIPYSYVVASGTPYSIFPVLGDGFEGVVGQPLRRYLGFKLVDRYGVPVQGVATTFRPPTGGAIDAADAQTDVYGIAAAQVTMGSQLGEQKFTADAGGLTVEFNGISRLRPTINAGGITNAGSGDTGTAQKGLAPGSYMAIYGQALAPLILAFRTMYLPISLANVSVSFDVVNGGVSVLSLPGRIHFVSPGQINVQIPWELEGYNSVSVKVSIGEISGAVYDLPLARNSPGFFEYPAGSGIPATLDESNKVVTASNPVQRGRVAQLFCNGLGPVDNRPQTGEATQSSPLSRVLDNVSVTIGGKSAVVEFKGLTPTAIGLYQLNVRVPNDVSAGSQPLVLTVNGVAAKTVNLPVQ